MLYLHVVRALSCRLRGQRWEPWLCASKEPPAQREAGDTEEPLTQEECPVKIETSRSARDWLPPTAAKPISGIRSCFNRSQIRPLIPTAITSVMVLPSIALTKTRTPATNHLSIQMHCQDFSKILSLLLSIQQPPMTFCMKSYLFSI